MQSPDSSTAGSATGSASPRACQNCARAKAKCVSQSSQQQCSRCLRLKKECIAVPKRTRKRRSPNTAKNTAQLEEKIESLVTLLSATKTAVHTNGEKQPDLAQNSQHEDVRRPDHRPTFSWTPEAPLHNSCNPPSWNPTLSSKQKTTVIPYSIATPASTVSGLSEPISAPSIDLQVKDPDRLLKIYRDNYEVDFPFIIIPADISAQQLNAKRPWVSITVNMVASHENRLQQLALAKQIVMEFATALLIRSEKSLDLLESLILYNVWQFYYAQGHPQYQSSAIMQLALAVLYDLGLNRPLREYEGPDMMPDHSGLAADNTKEFRRSSAERRAYLSLFIIISSLSCGMKKIDGLEHTPYLDYTCQFLLEAAEFQSDSILVFMARTQALVGSMSRKLQHGLVPGSTDSQAPQSMQAKSAKADLQSYLLILPPDIQDHSLVRRAYHSAEVFFYESCLHRSFFPSHQNSQRLDMLWACTIACKSTLNNFISLPMSLYNSLSIVTFSQMGHALSTAFKLSFIEIPCWDLAQVRATLNLLEYFNHIISRFGQVGAQIDNCQAIPVKRSFCTGGSLVMARIQTSYEARLAAEVEERQQEVQRGQAGIDEILAGEKFDYFDDTYLMSDWKWEEIMGEFMQE